MKPATVSSPRSNRFVGEHLTGARRRLFDSIATGERAALMAPVGGVVGHDGALVEPFNQMLLSPAIGDCLQQLGSAFRQGQLSPLLREIAILVVARETGSAIEWDGHARIAQRLGLSDAQIELIQQYENPEPGFSDIAGAQSAMRLTRACLSGEPVTGPFFEALSTDLSPEEIFEIVTVTGYYWTLARMLHVFDVDG